MPCSRSPSARWVSDMQIAAHTDAEHNRASREDTALDNTLHDDDRVIEISRVSTRFGEHVVHAELDLEVRRAEIFALVGGSGSGKMILLQHPDSGSIRVLGVDLRTAGDDEALALRR